MKAIKVALGAVSLMLASGITTQAADDGGWAFEFTPYIWYAGLEGDVTVGGQKFEFEREAGDIFDASEVGVSLRFSAEYERFVVGGLVDFFSLSTDNLEVENQPQGGSVDTDLVLAEVMAGYRFDGFSENQFFTVGLGVRHLAIEHEGVVNGQGAVSNERDITDVMLYVLPKIPMFASRIDGLSFNPWLGIGAGDSDLAYELFPQIQFNATENLALRFGYRTVGWNAKDDGNDENELNMSLSGLIVGLGLTF